MSISKKLVTVAKKQQKVFDAGKKSEYDEFWDEFQENGNRKQYSYAFCYGGWNDETYAPKYAINPTMCSNMFAYNARVTDTKVPIDLTNPNGTQKYAIFNGASKLKTIHKLIVNENNSYTASGGTFTNCTALENVTFEGVIGKSIDFQHSKLLSKASIENIVSCLSTSVTGHTLTLSQTAVNNAFEEDEWNSLIWGKTNWTVSLV